ALDGRQTHADASASPSVHERVQLALGGLVLAGQDRFDTRTRLGLRLDRRLLVTFRFALDGLRLGLAVRASEQCRAETREQSPRRIVRGQRFVRLAVAAVKLRPAVARGRRQTALVASTVVALRERID